MKEQSTGTDEEEEFLTCRRYIAEEGIRNCDEVNEENIGNIREEEIDPK